jgi:uncharacterized tellurite resistance protein B-like protein
MLEAINRFFRGRMPSPDAQTGDAELKLQVATCVLLLEAAHADDEFSPDERALISDLLRTRFSLSGSEAEELLALAEQEREQSSDLYRFSRVIGDNLTRPQKLEVLRQLWRIVYTDDRLEAQEDAMMHKLSNLLGLRHQELIALKLQVKEEKASD